MSRKCLIGQQSSGAIPFGTMVVLLLMWFGVSVHPSPSRDAQRCAEMRRDAQRCAERSREVARRVALLLAGAPLARAVARAFSEPRQVPLVFAGAFFGFKAQNQRARPRRALLLL